MLETSSKVNRYPGSQPFTLAYQGLFFGRDKDIEGLSKFINIEKLSILYGKSGLGKSSLINAGIMPVLEENAFYSIPIRLGSYNELTGQLPLQIVEEKLASEVSFDNFMLKIQEEEISLWQQIKSVQYEKPEKKSILLVFDQFEELFTYPEGIIKFGEELATILNDKMPRRFRRTIRFKLEQEPDFLSQEEWDFLDQPLNVKILLSIRSDKLSLLNRLSDYLPNILQNCYELKSLTKEQSRDAIIEPARKKGDFRSDPFDYTEEALHKMLSYLTQNDTKPVESFQLQILCQYLEEKIIQIQSKNNLQENLKVELHNLGNLEDIYQNYYDFNIQRIGNEDEQLSARKFIEEGLIFEAEERRISMYEGQVYSNYNLSPELLQKLVDTHLIRAEPHHSGGYLYELSHDTLVAPILKSKSRRTAQEILEQERLAAKIALEKEREKRINSRKRLIPWIVMLILFSMGALFVSINTKQKNEQLREALLIAQQKEAEALESNETALKEKLNAVEARIEADNMAGIASDKALEAERNRLKAELATIETDKLRLKAILTGRINNQIVRAKQQETEDPNVALLLAYQGFQSDKTNLNARFEVNSMLKRNKFYHQEFKLRDQILAVGFDSSGDYILAGAKNGTASIWDRNGNQKLSLQGHQGAIRAGVFIPNNNSIYLATAGNDRQIILWDSLGQKIDTLKGHNGNITSLVSDPKGNFLVSGSEDNTAIIWDIERRDTIAILRDHEGDVNAIAIDSSGTNIVTASKDTRIILWDQTGKFKKSFDDHERDVLSVAISSDSRYIVSGSLDNNVRLFDLNDPSKNQIFTDHKGPVGAVAFSPDNRFFLTGANDRVVIYRDIRTPDWTETFRGHSKGISSLAFSSDGKTILTGSFDRSAKLWSVDFNKLKNGSKIHSKSVRAIFSPDDQYILTGSYDGRALLFQKDGQGDTITFSHSSNRSIRSVAFSPDGKKVLTGGDDETAILWDVNGDQLQIFERHNSSIMFVAFSPNGKYILTGSSDRTAILWDINGTVIRTFSGHTNRILSVAISPDKNGKYILTGSSDHTARLWNLQGRELLKLSHESEVKAVGFSKTGDSLITGGYDNKVKIWHRPTGKLLKTFSTESNVYAVSFDPSGKTVLSANDYSANRWNLADDGAIDQENVRPLETFDGLGSEVLSAFFSKDGKTILTGDISGKVNVFYTLSGFLDPTSRKISPLNLIQLEKLGMLKNLSGIDLDEKSLSSKLEYIEYLIENAKDKKRLIQINYLSKVSQVLSNINSSKNPDPMIKSDIASAYYHLGRNYLDLNDNLDAIEAFNEAEIFGYKNKKDLQKYILIANALMPNPELISIGHDEKGKEVEIPKKAYNYFKDENLENSDILIDLSRFTGNNLRTRGYQPGMIDSLFIVPLLSVGKNPEELERAIDYYSFKALNTPSYSSNKKDFYIKAIEIAKRFNAFEDKVHESHWYQVNEVYSSYVYYFLQYESEPGIDSLLKICQEGIQIIPPKHLGQIIVTKANLHIRQGDFEAAREIYNQYNSKEYLSSNKSNTFRQAFVADIKNFQRYRTTSHENYDKALDILYSEWPKNSKLDEGLLSQGFVYYENKIKSIDSLELKSEYYQKGLKLSKILKDKGFDKNSQNFNPTIFKSYIDTLFNQDLIRNNFDHTINACQLGIKSLPKPNSGYVYVKMFHSYLRVGKDEEWKNLCKDLGSEVFPDKKFAERYYIAFLKEIDLYSLDGNNNIYEKASEFIFDEIIASKQKDLQALVGNFYRNKFDNKQGNSVTNLNRAMRLYVSANSDLNGEDGVAIAKYLQGIWYIHKGNYVSANSNLLEIKSGLLINSPELHACIILIYLQTGNKGIARKYFEQHYTDLEESKLNKLYSQLVNKIEYFPKKERESISEKLIAFQPVIFRDNRALKISFLHLASKDNILPTGTLLNPSLILNSEALLFVSYNWRMGQKYNPSPIGVRQVEKHSWEIVNHDSTPPLEKAGYNIFITDKNNSQAFIHKANSNNTKGYITNLDHELTNSKPDAKVFVTMRQENGSPLNNQPIGLYYSDDKWKIVNLSTAPLPLGLMFNVYVAGEDETAFIHKATKGKIIQNYTDFSHPSTNGKDDIPIFINQRITSLPPKNAKTIGLWYHNNRWSIYNQVKHDSGIRTEDFLPENVEFNVLVPPN